MISPILQVWRSKYTGAQRLWEPCLQWQSYKDGQTGKRHKQVKDKVHIGFGVPGRKCSCQISNYTGSNCSNKISNVFETRISLFELRSTGGFLDMLFLGSHFHSPLLVCLSCVIPKGFTNLIQIFLLTSFSRVYTTSPGLRYLFSVLLNPLILIFLHFSLKKASQWSEKHTLLNHILLADPEHKCWNSKISHRYDSSFDWL